jgi:hypothetical protein
VKQLLDPTPRLSAHPPIHHHLKAYTHLQNTRTSTWRHLDNNANEIFCGMDRTGLVQCGFRLCGGEVKRFDECI